MTKKGRPASVKKQCAAQRVRRGVGMCEGEIEKERDGGAELIIRKLQRSQVQARGNEGTSGTSSIHSEALSVTNQEIMTPVLLNIQYQWGLLSRPLGVLQDDTCLLFWGFSLLTINHVHFTLRMAISHLYLDWSLNLQAAISIKFTIEWQWSGRHLEVKGT